MSKKHSVNASGYTFNFLEDLNHVVNQAKAPEAWCIVFLSPEKLSALNDSRCRGQDWVNLERLVKAEDELKAGKDVYTPVYYSNSTLDFLPRAMNGRHRTLALFNLGVKSIPVAVPVSDAEAFQARFA